MRRVVLRVDAMFLAAAGVFGLVSDLQSYVSGTGPFGQTFFRNPTVIGVVEAHSLAVLTAGTLVSGDTSHGTFRALGRGYCPCRHGRKQHRLVRCVQARAGGDSGLAVTVVHFAFIGVNLFFITRASVSPD